MIADNATSKGDLEMEHQIQVKNLICAEVLSSASDYKKRKGLNLKKTFASAKDQSS